MAMSSVSARSGQSLEAIAGRFHPPDQIDAIDVIGSGNVNDTFLVRLVAAPDAGAEDGTAFVM